MNLDVYAYYRAKGWTALQAFQAAQVSDALHLAWEAGSACWQEAGLTLRAMLVPEDHPDLSYLDGFSRQGRPGAIRPSYGKAQALSWFHPAVPAAAHYQALRDQKLGKTPAREQARQAVRQAYQRALAHGQTWAECMLVVTAYRGGLVLGRALVGGIASDADSRYLNAKTRELAAEALAEARQTLACLAPAVQARLFGSVA